MPHVAWTLTDNSTGSPVVLSFEINPNEFDPPGRNSNIVSEQVTAPNGQTILFQGRDQVKKATLRGRARTESFFTDLNTWKDKWYPLVLTDDQGQTWDIIIESWQWSRVRKASNNWLYDYTATVIVL